MMFLSAGVVHMLENVIPMSNYDCKSVFIDPATGAASASCDSSFYTFDQDDCDCSEFQCVAKYTHSDREGFPSLLSCEWLPFFDCFYFIVITMTTVGM
jgi:hypothetical protein